MKRFSVFIYLIASCAYSAWATGLNDLEEFIKTVKTGRADFTQVVTSPPKDGQAPRVKTSTGTFEFSRPNRFRFNYLKPFAQILVADGKTLWLYDEDLKQVTTRRQADVLGSTPAALIASAADVRALQADFSLVNAPDRDGMHWVAATPKSGDGQLQSVRIGFRPAAADAFALEALEIVDSFGQRSVLTFRLFEANAVLPERSFEFKAPAGVDVLRQ